MSENQEGQAVRESPERFSDTGKKTANNDDQIIRLLKANRKNSAARVYSKQYGYSMPESVSAVQRMADQHGIKTSNGTVRIVVFAILVTVGLLVYSVYLNIKG